MTDHNFRWKHYYPTRTLRYWALFEAFLGKCALCGEQIDPMLVSTHTKAGSIDHIKPLSHGGNNSFANCQLVHRDCNFKKGDVYKGEHSNGFLYNKDRSWYSCDSFSGSFKNNHKRYGEKRGW